MYKAILALLIFHIVHVSSTGPDFVIMMARHAARGPIDGTYDTNSDWNKNYGELTDVGARMGYLLGSVHAAKYPHLLLPYSSKTVYFRSTNVDRTIATANEFIQGAYGGALIGTAYDPNLTGPLADPILVLSAKATVASAKVSSNTVPNIPVNLINSSTYEKVLDGLSTTCPISANWSGLNGSMSSTIYNTYSLNLRNTVNKSGLVLSGWSALYYFGDLAIANRYSNYSIPGNITYDSQLYQDAKFIARWTMTAWYAGLTIQNQVGSIQFLQNVIDNFHMSLNGTSSYKFMYYASHDTTLLPILGVLGLLNTTCMYQNYNAQKAGQSIPYPFCVYPGFTSNVKFELYRNGGNPYVMAYYDDALFGICGDEDQCALPDLVDYVAQITNNYSKADFERMCYSS